MATMSKRRLTYVITAIAGAVIVILAVILMQQPIPTSTTPQVKTPPSVSTAAATGIDQTVATLNGNLAGIGTAATVNVGFRYGTNSGLAGATNVSVSSVIASTPFDESLTGLTPGTAYYFQAWAKGDGFVAATAMSFTTLSSSGPSAHAPAVVTNGASSVGQTSATLNGNLQSLGTASSVTVGFLYSADSGLAGATNVSLGGKSGAGVFAQAVKGLSTNTTYYVEAWAVGNGFAKGSIVPFTTTAAPSGGGNGNQVPPGWAHAACPSQAKGWGVRARCEMNMTYGELKKEGLTLPPPSTLTANAAKKGADNSAWLRTSDPGNSGDHRSDNARQW